MDLLDLNMCDPSCYLDFSWSVYDVWGSDHYPVILRNDKEIYDHQSKWKLKKASGKKFRSLCSDQLTWKNNITTDEFTDSLISIVEERILKNTISSRKNRSWFNKTVNLRKVALWKFNKELTSNLIQTTYSKSL